MGKPSNKSIRAAALENKLWHHTTTLNWDLRLLATNIQVPILFQDFHVKNPFGEKYEPSEITVCRTSVFCHVARFDIMNGQLIIAKPKTS